jgi:hypothetical protein
LTPDPTGWVAGATNGAGIQGSFYTFSDAAGTPPGVTAIAPTDFSDVADTTICASGMASEVPDDTGYSQFWGGGVGFNLADPGNMTGAQPWNRGNVVGFSFNITGANIPPAAQFRFKATFFEGAAVNSDYCAPIAAAGPNSFQLSQVVNQCYTGGLGAPPLAPTALLESLQWQVATVIGQPTPFDFCIENLTAIVAP